MPTTGSHDRIRLIDDLVEPTQEINKLLNELDWGISTLMPNLEDDKTIKLDKEEAADLRKEIDALSDCYEEIQSLFEAQWETLLAARVRFDLRRVA